MDDSKIKILFVINLMISIILFGLFGFFFVLFFSERRIIIQPKITITIPQDIYDGSNEIHIEPTELLQ